MSTTHGPETKRKHFSWRFFADSSHLIIENENGRKHSYSLQEIQRILETIQRRFGGEPFPLANNIQKLYEETEKPGLGVIIHEQGRNDISHAQGASYLGVVLEECGYLRWNGKSFGIEWRLIDTDFGLDAIASRLVGHS
ncbi:MAG: hypothetical protein AB1894_12555 [Chloroflexota bacterium]